MGKYKDVRNIYISQFTQGKFFTFNKTKKTFQSINFKIKMKINPKHFRNLNKYAGYLGTTIFFLKYYCYCYYCYLFV